MVVIRSNIVKVFSCLVVFGISNAAVAFIPRHTKDLAKKLQQGLTQSIAVDKGEVIEKDAAVIKTTAPSVQPYRSGSQLPVFDDETAATTTTEYWNDSRIHTLGNCGFMGAVHAAMAPLSTRLIDDVAYKGVDIRKTVAEKLSMKYQLYNNVNFPSSSSPLKVLDMCCGVGFSTRALMEAFPTSTQVVGIDTSPQMLAMARYISNHVEHLKTFNSNSVLPITTTTQSLYMKGNAETASLLFRQGEKFDVISIMYAFHEIPFDGRQRILDEAKRLLTSGGIIAIVDISTHYTPSPSMLAGEPYVLEYQKNIHNQLRSQVGFQRSTYQTIVAGHVGMWTLRKK